jgi:hypothetical protein
MKCAPSWWRPTNTTNKIEYDFRRLWLSTWSWSRSRSRKCWSNSLLIGREHGSQNVGQPHYWLAGSTAVKCWPTSLLTVREHGSQNVGQPHYWLAGSTTVKCWPTSLLIGREHGSQMLVNLTIDWLGARQSNVGQPHYWLADVGQPHYWLAGSTAVKCWPTSLLIGREHGSQNVGQPHYWLAECWSIMKLFSWSSLTWHICQEDTSQLRTPDFVLRLAIWQPSWPNQDTSILRSCP